ncbi:hypothetical protein D3C80_1041880 [compost metagenome]
MTIKRLGRTLCVAAALSLTTLTPVLAASPMDQRTQSRDNSGSNASERPQRQDRRRGREAAPDPAAVLAQAQGFLTAANTNCQATEAKLLGQTAEKISLYEAVCATGPGYIVVGSTPPETLDCLVLASQADKKRQADPAADVGTVCTLPANDNAMAVFTAYAREAAVPCQVDQGAVIGATSDGAFVYEIGCAGADGYRIQRASTGWEKTECLQVLQQNATCSFTTPAEQAATVKSWLTGSEAAACDVQQVRLMGFNNNGRFYEATCAGADGVIVRFNTEMAVQQVYPCAIAEKIGGGCKLTTTAPAATTPEA